MKTALLNTTEKPCSHASEAASHTRRNKQQRAHSYLLHICTSVDGACVAGIWIIGNAFVRHIAVFAHLGSLLMSNWTLVCQAETQCKCLAMTILVVSE